jgi:hypothetical protein
MPDEEPEISPGFDTNKKLMPGDDADQIEM